MLDLLLTDVQKAADFVNFCDAFSIPVLTLTNVAGFAATVESEKNMAKAVARLTYAFANATVPKVNVIVGKAFGSAYVTMNSKSVGADLVYAWPTAEIGMMDAKLAAQIMYPDADADTQSAKAAKYKELQSSPNAAAARGYVDAIIEPADTRKYVIGAFEMLFTKERIVRTKSTVRFSEVRAEVKKKISLLGLILILVLSFTGCGKSETTEYDQTTMEQYADTIISAFSSMSEEDMDYYENLRDLNLDITLLQAQLPIDGSDFLTMIESWKASQEECGAYIEHGDWTMKVSHDGATLSSEGKFEDRDAEIAFTFNEKSDMESMTVSAHYTTGEILKKAGLNTILGMGTVFVVLIFISFIIYLLGFIPKLQKKLSGKGKAAEEKKETPVQAAPAFAVSAPQAAGTDDGELAAVIAAAIAASEGTSTDGFRSSFYQEKKIK